MSPHNRLMKAREQMGHGSAAHTPGPWAVAPVGTMDFRAPEGGDFYIVSPDKTCVAIIWMYGKEGEANGRLIAAAPELLELLARCNQHMTWSPEDELTSDEFDELQTSVEAALAKVRP